MNNDLKSQYITDNINVYCLINNCSYYEFISYYLSLLIEPYHHQMRNSHDSMSLIQAGECLGNVLQINIKRLSEACRYYDPLIFSDAKVAVSVQKTTLIPPDSVRIVKNDYNCITARESVTFIDMFSKVFDTISSPVNEIIVEA
ncbi:MAG: hypothetical protein ACSLEN_01170 [Candidatus Malihini olakiniferum]